MGCKPGKAKKGDVQDPILPDKAQHKAEVPLKEDPDKAKGSDVHSAGGHAAPDAVAVPAHLDAADFEPPPVHVPPPEAAAAVSSSAAPPAKEGEGAPAAAGAEGAGGPRDAPPRRRVPSKTVPATIFKVEANGFKAVPEVMAFSCSEEMCAPFTLPAEALTYEPSQETIVTTFKNGDQERKIHCNTRLTDAEQERLQQMRQEARAQGLEFMPSVTAMATRYLSRARMDVKKALALMKVTQEWRTNFFKDGALTDAMVKEDFQHGIVYFTGRDYALRPLIVIRAARIPQQWYKERRIDKFINILIYCMEYFLRYMVVPGKVENLSVIVDLNGLGISQVPIGPLGEVYKVLGSHYIGRVYKFYACNVSTALSMIASTVKVLLTDRQKQKLNILDNVSDMKAEFALHQLEEDLGGSRPKVARFFPFPLQPGPFAAGYSGKPDADAVPGVHEALTQGGAIGRLWDPKQSPEDNTKLEYGPKAAAILKRCNIPVPPEVLLERETSCLAVSRSGENLPHESDNTHYNQDPPKAEKKVSANMPISDLEIGNPNEEPQTHLDQNDLLMGGRDKSPRLEGSACGGGSFFCCSL